MVWFGLVVATSSRRKNGGENGLGCLRGVAQEEFISFEEDKAWKMDEEKKKKVVFLVVFRLFLIRFFEKGSGM